MAPATPATPTIPALREPAPLVGEVVVALPEAVGLEALAEAAAEPEAGTPLEAAGEETAAERVPLVVPGAAPMIVK